MDRKYHGRAALALCALLLACGSTVLAAEKAEATLTHEEALGAGGKIVFENLLGAVTLMPGDAHLRSARVSARVVAEAKSVEEARALVDTIRLTREVENGATRIRVDYPVDAHPALRLPRTEAQGIVARWITPLLHRKTVAANYAGRMVEVGKAKDSVALAVYLDVTLPLDVDVTVRQFVGPIHCKGVRGTFTLEGVEGQIFVDQLYGTLDVRTTSGDVDVWKLHGERLQVRTTGGQLTVGDIDATEAVLETSSGTIRGSGLRGTTLRVSSDSGKVQLEELDPTRLEVVSGSGELDLASELGRVRAASIRSESGDVVLRVGRFAPFDLTARTEDGSVDAKDVGADVLEQGKGASHLQRGSGGAEVTVASVKGGITVRPLGPGKYNFAAAFPGAK